MFFRIFFIISLFFGFLFAENFCGWRIAHKNSSNHLYFNHGVSGYLKFDRDYYNDHTELFFNGDVEKASYHAISSLPSNDVKKFNAVIDTINDYYHNSSYGTFYVTFAYKCNNIDMSGLERANCSIPYIPDTFSPFYFVDDSGLDKDISAYINAYHSISQKFGSCYATYMLGLSSDYHVTKNGSTITRRYLHFLNDNNNAIVNLPLDSEFNIYADYLAIDPGSANDYDQIYYLSNDVDHTADYCINFVIPAIKSVYDLVTLTDENSTLYRLDLRSVRFANFNENYYHGSDMSLKYMSYALNFLKDTIDANDHLSFAVFKPKNTEYIFSSISDLNASTYCPSYAFRHVDINGTVHNFICKLSNNLSSVTNHCQLKCVYPTCYTKVDNITPPPPATDDQIVTPSDDGIISVTDNYDDYSFFQDYVSNNGNGDSGDNGNGDNGNGDNGNGDNGNGDNGNGDNGNGDNGNGDNGNGDNGNGESGGSVFDTTVPIPSFQAPVLDPLVIDSNISDSVSLLSSDFFQKFTDISNSVRSVYDDILNDSNRTIKIFEDAFNKFKNFDVNSSLDNIFKSENNVTIDNSYASNVDNSCFSFDLFGQHITIDLCHTFYSFKDILALVFYLIFQIALIRFMLYFITHA